MLKVTKSTAIDKHLGIVMRRLRKEKRITMEALCEACDITTPQLCKYENGINRVTLGRLIMFAKAFGMPLKAIMQEIELQEATPADTPHMEFTANIYKLVSRSPEVAVTLNRLLLSYNREKNNEE